MASIDILMSIVKNSPSQVRDYISRNINSEDDCLMNIIIESMLCNGDLGVTMDLLEIIRVLLDPENMLVNKNEKADFLDQFYSHCLPYLTYPLLAQSSTKKADLFTVQVLSHVLELLGFCVDHHAHHIKNYTIDKDLLRHILVLLKSRNTFLKLSAIRFVRKIIAKEDEIYNGYIV